MRVSASASQRITGSFQMSGICRLNDGVVGLLVAITVRRPAESATADSSEIGRCA
jgi:hypothetical protein